MSDIRGVRFTPPLLTARGAARGGFERDYLSCSCTHFSSAANVMRLSCTLARMVPWWASAMLLAMERPMPKPPVAAVREASGRQKRSNRRSSGPSGGWTHSFSTVRRTPRRSGSSATRFSVCRPRRTRPTRLPASARRAAAGSSRGRWPDTARFPAQSQGI